MARVVVHLLDGFSDDTVALKINGAEVTREAGVTTQLLLGAAKDLSATAPHGPATVAVSVESRGLEAETTAALRGDVELIASIEAGELTVSPAPASFGLM